MLDIAPTDAISFIREFPGTREATFEPAAIALMLYVLRANDGRTMLDIGASHGYFAIHAASGAPDMTAHAFEMRPPVHQTMVQEIDAHGLCGRAIPHLAGMSDRHEGECDIWYSGMRMYEHEPLPETHREAWWRRLKRSSPLMKARVTVTSIDAFAAGNSIGPDFIKIDVEGYEPKVLAGGMQTLRTLRPPILLELHRDEMMSRFGTTRASVVRPLLDMGYNGLWLTDRRSTATCELAPIDAATLQRQKTEMLFFHVTC